MKSNDAEMAGCRDGRSNKDLSSHPVRICPYCGDEYVAFMMKQRICGKYKCRLAKNSDMAKARYGREHKPLEPVPCRVCGDVFIPYRPDNTVCKKPECKHIAQIERLKEFRALVEAEYECLHSRHTKFASGREKCKCPRCETSHLVKMPPPDPPIMPRVYCPDCKKTVGMQSGYDYITSGAHLSGGLPGSERTPARMGVATL